MKNGMTNQGWEGAHVATVSARGQLVIPASLRRRYGLKGGEKVLWVDTGRHLLLVPLPPDPVRDSRGFVKGGRLTQALLRARQRDKAREAG